MHGMLKSILIAGVLLVTSNFMPSSPITVPTIIAANTHSVSMPAVQTNVKIIQSARSLPATVKTFLPTDDAMPDPTDGLLPEEREFIGRVNDERTSRGLNALELDPLLVQVARSHSREMCDLNYFDHHSPSQDLRTPMDRFLNGLRTIGQSTPDYVLVGENIYYCSESSETYNVEFGHQALMNSPGHRANILEPRFAKIGVGIYRDAKGQFWVTEMFLRDQR
jgi:uncharacterized protein YkwD